MAASIPKSQVRVQVPSTTSLLQVEPLFNGCRQKPCVTDACLPCIRTRRGLGISNAMRTQHQQLQQLRVVRDAAMIQTTATLRSVATAWHQKEPVDFDLPYVTRTPQVISFIDHFRN